MKTLMVKQDSNPTNLMKAPEHLKYSTERGCDQTLIVSPQRTNSKFKPAFSPSSTPVRLELEALNCFEIVEHQFQTWGITFKNAIALQPSNPAFMTQPNQIVLMSGPNSGFLEISFQHPLQLIEARVTSSQPTVLSAFNYHGQEVAHTQMPAPEQTEVMASILSPALLQVSTPEIYRVTFCTFDGQLIVDYLKFHF